MKILQEHGSRIGYAILAYVGAWQLGYTTPPDVPDYWPVVALAVVSAAGVGMLAGDKIAALIPDGFDNILVAQDADKADGGEIWELNDRAIEELEIKKAEELFEWGDTTETVYECRNFNSDELVAVGNWKGAKTGNELSKPVERDEVMRQIENLRESHEKDARYGKAIRSSLPALLRNLDKQRAKHLNAALEGHISPDLADQSIDDMIRDHVPERVLPDYMSRDDGADQEEDDGAGMSVEILDDAEALEPLAPDERAVNDGGKEL